ncbi:MAG: ABC transporter permease [Bryobacteraceae bacterium]
MWQNIRFSVRIFSQSPGLTAVILLTLALGIGANTTLFSVVNSVLLRPLPYQDPDRIVQLYDLYPVTNSQITSSFPKYTFLREHARSFDALAATSSGTFQISGPAPAPPAELAGARVSANFFRVFGVKPTAGRTFLDGEEKQGSAGVAVISHTLWQNRFGSDPTAVGKTVNIDGEATAIVGIMPAGFDFPENTEVWTPRIFGHPAMSPVQVQRGGSYLLFFARLAGGAQIPGAQSEVSLLSGQYDESHKGFGDTGRAMVIAPLKESMVEDVQLTLLVLLGAAGFVLLIASANVANLLLARSIGRQKEIAIRACLGAGKARLLAQFLTESVLLSGAGAALGVLFSVWSTGLISNAVADLLPRAGEIHIDATVLLYTVAVATITGILFGLGPALHAMRVDLNEALKATGRGLSHGGRLRGAMIVSEVALAMVLLAGAGLLLRSFLRLQSVDPGFRPDSLYTMHIGLAGARYPQRPQQVAFYDRVLQNTAAIPGARNVALSNALPVNGRAIGYFFNVEGRAALEPSKAPTFWLHSISPAYLQTMGIPLLRGRFFTDADTDATRPVGIINEVMARRFWPNEDPIGRHVIYSREGVTAEIVGIAANVKIGGLGDENADNQMYVSYRQRPFLTMSLVVRGPASAAADVRRAILAIDSDQPVAAIRPMDEVIAKSLSTPRLRTALIGAFAALALLLALIGIAGVAAWSVSRRTNEIGIRMALGARPVNILTMIARESLTLIGLGELVGLAGAFALTRFLSTFLFGVTPWDPFTFATVTVLLGLVGLTACVFAARRALRIDPVVALRRE